LVELYQDINNYHHFTMDLQLFCGVQAVSNCVKINWTRKSYMQHAQRSKTRVNFNIPYKALPLYTSLVVKIKAFLNVEDEKTKKKTIEKKTIAWVNFRLFDYLKKLRTGIFNYLF
jgi:hypothetical protein